MATSPFYHKTLRPLRSQLMGVINISPESFFKGSVAKNQSALFKKIDEMEKAACDYIDVGAMSTAPYLKTKISIEDEKKRLDWAISRISKRTRIPISADTFRAEPALAALNAGAQILNDISGLTGDPQMKKVISKFKGAVLMAHPNRLRKKMVSPAKEIKRQFNLIVKESRRAGLSPNQIALDPGIGFFRLPKIPWWKWDLQVLKNLNRVSPPHIPILVGLSRKSFIGQILNGRPAADRLAGSLGLTGACLFQQSLIIRTHDVQETRDVIEVIEALKGK